MLRSLGDKGCALSPVGIKQKLVTTVVKTSKKDKRGEFERETGSWFHKANKPQDLRSYKALFALF